MTDTFTPPAPLQTAVLFLVFNRPDTTAQVFEAIRKAKPPRLYVAADGPRAIRAGEAEKVAKVREIATAVDWPCEVKTLFRQENLGCKYAVSGGITWFFEHEEQGIILEDDCLPSQSFFWYCEELLNLFSANEDISMIAGSCFFSKKDKGNESYSSYYLSKFSNIWGWASWRRAWKGYDVNIYKWPDFKGSSQFKEVHPYFSERMYWTGILDQVYLGKIDTWDYQWLMHNWAENRYSINPDANLIKNIGFGPEATHTHNETSIFSRVNIENISIIKHPESLYYNKSLDDVFFKMISPWHCRKYMRVFYIARIFLRSIYRVFKVNGGRW